MPFLYPATELQLLLLPVVSLRTEENNLDNNTEIITIHQAAFTTSQFIKNSCWIRDEWMNGNPAVVTAAEEILNQYLVYFFQIW